MTSQVIAAPKPAPVVVDLTHSDSPEPEEKLHRFPSLPLIDWEEEFRQRRKEPVEFKQPLPHTEDVITIEDDDLPEYHEVHGRSFQSSSHPFQNVLSYTTETCYVTCCLHENGSADFEFYYRNRPNGHRKTCRA